MKGAERTYEAFRRELDLREGEDTMLIPVEDSCQFTGEFAIVWK